MRNRVARLCVVAALVASAAGAAVVVRAELTPAVPAHPEDFDRRLDRLHALVVETMRAEAAYVAPGQNPTPALARFPDVFNEISTRAGELSTLVTSPGGIREVRAFAEATSRLAQADAEAREHLLLGDVQSAAHVIFERAGTASQQMTTALAHVRDFERARILGANSVAGLSDRGRIIVGSVAALWGIVLFVFAVVPSRGRRTPDQPLPGTDGEARAESPADVSARPAIAAARAVDLEAAADLCTEIARVDSTAALNGLLSRAVRLLDANGIIVWVESSGQLFAAAAAGYPPDTLARLAPISRDDAHAVAAAWREAATETVDATSDADGAVAVPLFSGARCFGVFAVELKPGREQDAGTRAVARLLAAQLTTVVGGDPSSSTALATTGT
jgi:hypothetical protein